MCDASDYAMSAVLGQRTNKTFKVIYYAYKTFNEAQENYSTTEKKMLTTVFVVKNLDHIYWGPMLSYILIMQQSYIRWQRKMSNQD